MSGELACAHGGCVALALPGGSLCSIHTSIGQRVTPGIGVRCYACGEPIRLGKWFLVRAEGAFHLRPACSAKAPSDYKIPIFTSREARKAAV